MTRATLKQVMQSDAQIVYALAADAANTYWRMTCVSAASARSWAPRATLRLIVDRATASALGNLIGEGSPTAGLFSAIEAVDVAPDGASPALRSRALKTSLRRLVAGPFLFLDSDTVLSGDPQPIFDTQEDFAAVSDQHRRDVVLVDVEQDVFRACGWAPVTRANFNSGVMFWNDTPGAQRLGDLYAAKWRESVQTTGRHNDQQALNSALEDGDASLRLLADRFNAQIGLRPEFAFDAVVWHFFSSDRSRVPTLRTVFDDHWAGKATRPLSDADFRRTHPWRCTSPIDHAIAATLKRNPSGQNLGFNDWRRLWLAGDSTSAVRELAARARQKLGRAARRLGISRSAA